jgi:hypothetical protein
MSQHPLSASEYQAIPAVRARILEFCGLEPCQDPGCVYVTGMGADDGPQATWGDVSAAPPGSLDTLVIAGKDVARSMWDTRELLVYVDLDYRNTDAVGEAYLHPADCFLKLEPTYRALMGLFDEFGMPMLDLVTGAGYSMVGRIPLGGPAATRLAALTSSTPAWLRTHPERRPAWATTRIGDADARAHRGLGLALDFLLHRVLPRAASSSPIPVVVNNADVGIGPGGRESISIDLTHMGDPLDVRHIRVAFAVYQKHRLRPDLFGAAAGRIPALAVIPRRRQPLLETLESRRLERAAVAAVSDASIPDVAAGLGRMLDEYENSDLAHWHRGFETMEPHPPSQWADTYDRLDLAALPPCVATCLEYPNDLLLKPTHIQMLVRSLLARGWHAGHVAGLVWSVYSRPGLWGDHWRRVDPRTRAEFDVRTYAGLIALGLDEGIDFNCVSTQEKGTCPGSGCRFDLRHERERLLGRGQA